MKVGACIVTLLLLVGCASKPARCGRRLTPINASIEAGSHARVVGP